MPPDASTRPRTARTRAMPARRRLPGRSTARPLARTRQPLHGRRYRARTVRRRRRSSATGTTCSARVVRYRPPGRGAGARRDCSAIDAHLGGRALGGDDRRRPDRPLVVHDRGLDGPVRDLARRARAQGRRRPARSRRRADRGRRAARTALERAAHEADTDLTRRRWTTVEDDRSRVEAKHQAAPDRGPARRGRARAGAPRERGARAASRSRSTGCAPGSAPGTSCSRARGAGLKGVEAQLPKLAELGFDVLYLPPIHPIGLTQSQGPQQRARRPRPDDPARPGRSATAAAATTRSTPSSARSRTSAR